MTVYINTICNFDLQIFPFSENTAQIDKGSTCSAFMTPFLFAVFSFCAFYGTMCKCSNKKKKAHVTHRLVGLIKMYMTILNIMGKLQFIE